MKNSLLKKLVVSTSLMLLSSAVLAVGGSDPDPTPTPPPTGSTSCGAAPTSTQLLRTGASGPFTVATKSVSSSAASGFGGGTIHYPTNASSCGRMGGIAVVPGFVSAQSSIRWWGPRLASWGFVVITIDTNSGYDQPDSRATQLSRALDHIINDSTVRNMIDPNRLGAIGWSMGGGGTLKLSTDRAAVRAIIPQAPYYSGSYGTSRTPAFFIGCENDSVASTGTHVNRFYDRHAGPRMHVEIDRGSHYCANSGNGNEGVLGKAGVAWMKRYIDGDTRFNQFLCANDNYGSRSDVSRYRYSSCP